MDEGKIEGGASDVFEEKPIDKSSEAEKFRQAGSPREALLQMSQEGNFSQEYQQARVIGGFFLPLFLKDGFLERYAKRYGFTDSQLQQYESKLKPVSSGEIWNKETVSSAVQASLELSLLAAHVAGTKDFGKELQGLKAKTITPAEAAFLYKMKIATGAAYAFFNQQQERNPDLVRAAADKYCRKTGSFNVLKDDMGRKLYAQTVMEGATNIFPRQDLKDMASPFYHYRKALGGFSLSVPEVSSMTELRPDVVSAPVQITKEKERPLNRLLQMIKRPQKESAQHVPAPALSEA